MPGLYVGLMSGTSLDGVDAVLADFGGGAGLIHSYYQPFQPQLRDELLALQDSSRDELHRSALTSRELSRAYAEAVRTLLAQAGVAAHDVRAIGCHGQTVRHAPDEGYTIQLVSGALLAELAGTTVVCDFRSRDIAAGGQGAPLVPAFHQDRFHDPATHRVIVNIGGIANLTDLPVSGHVTGFDCGPGNVLMDAWIYEHQGRAYDEGGRWASEGRVVPALLERLRSHEFFGRKPPKSTGRETFNAAWVRRSLGGTERPVDVQATLLELTAAGIVGAIRQLGGDPREIYACGGGARNGMLMTRIAALLPGLKVGTTDELGIAADWVEALAFAWLARQTLDGKPGNLPAVTGAQGPRVLGAIYPA